MNESDAGLGVGRSEVTVSIIIPTYNRAHLWRRGLLVESLRSQTSPPDEIVICDDNSSDDTLTILKAVRGILQSERVASPSEPSPIIRLLRCTASKIMATQASALADNLLFLYATGDVLVHLDDDGFVSPRLVEWIRAQDWRCNQVRYGINRFVNPQTLQLEGLDQRLPALCMIEGQTRCVRPQDNACWGALWATRRSHVRRLGGHEMENVHWRGCDSRLGWRLGMTAKSFVCAIEPMTFTHLGWSWKDAICRSKTNLRDILTMQRTPQLLNCSLTKIANGGEVFWRHCGKVIAHEEIP